MLKSFTKALPFFLCLSFFFLAACSGDDAEKGTVGAQNGTDEEATLSEKADSAERLMADSVEEDSLSLALQSIDLTQGKGGIEVWRLKAEWANMTQEDGKIVVRKPILTYFMPPPDNGELLVVSEKGTIDQQEQILQFIQDVEISGQDGVRIIGDLLVYNGTAATMTFPKGGFFSQKSEGMDGEAPFVRWYMNERRIEALGGVSVRFQQEAAAPAGP